MLNNNSLSYLFIASTLSLVVYHSPISIASPVFANDYQYLVANSNSNDSDNETILVEKADLLFNEQKFLLNFFLFKYDFSQLFRDMRGHFINNKLNIYFIEFLNLI